MKKRVIITLGIMQYLAVIFFCPVSLAGKYDIKKMTPEVKQALENRRDRFDNLKALQSSGKIGENNRGYVQVLAQDDSLQAVVKAENEDRSIIYETIAEQNGLEDVIETIEKVFAQVQREKASSGEMIQLENGEWITKK